MPETILVTEKEFAKAEQIFRRTNDFVIIPAPGEEAGVSAAVITRRARAVIIGVECYTGPLYRALREVSIGCSSLLARFGVGHDGVDKKLARENGVLVCNTPGALDISVAEQALWLVGNFSRHIGRLDSQLRSGKFTSEVGSELHGKLLGVLGFGLIGRRVAAMAHFGFGMRVWAAGDERIEQLEAREGRRMAEIQSANGVALYTNDADELIRECDVLGLHLPALPSTHHFIAGEFQRPTQVVTSSELPADRNPAEKAPILVG